jgi:hypothetical protein
LEEERAQMNRGELERKRRGGNRQNILTAIGTALCILLIPLLFIQLMFILKNCTGTQHIFNVVEYVPFAVNTDFMEPEIQEGDLIICRSVDLQTIANGDLIVYYRSQSDDEKLSVAGSVKGTGDNKIEVGYVAANASETGKTILKVQNGLENGNNGINVSEEQLIGRYEERIGGAGKIVMYMRTRTGMVAIGVVTLILILLMIRWKKNGCMETSKMLYTALALVSGLCLTSGIAGGMIYTIS